MTRAGAINRDRAAVQFDETSHERQPDPEPAPRAIQRMVGLHEEIEDVSLHLGRDADPGVSHSQHGLVAFAAERDRDPAAGLGVLGGVVQQVRDDLFQTGRVALDPQRLGREMTSKARAGTRSIRGRAASTACSTTELKSTAFLRSSTLPRVIRETSKRSSSRRVMCWIWRPATSSDSSTSAFPWTCMRMICRVFASGASGLRSSWASMARNSSFR